MRRGGVAWVEHRSLAGEAGLVHGVTLRSGGVSPYPRLSLNLARTRMVPDDPGLVAENRSRLLDATGLGGHAWVLAGEVHGARTGRARPRSGRRFSTLPGRDALWTDRPGVAVALTAADCLPLFLWDPAGRRGGIAHVGRRGAVAGVARRLAASLCRAGSRPEGLVAALGPAIGPCCYEVDDGVARRWMAAGLPVAEAKGGRPRLDLPGAVLRELERAGVPIAGVARPPCTACRRDVFFSHRGDRGRTGRFLAFLALR